MAIRYAIVDAGYVGDLESTVQELINDGWKLQGGVSVTWMNDCTVFHQAVTFVDPDEEDE